MFIEMNKTKVLTGIFLRKKLLLTLLGVVISVAKLSAQTVIVTDDAAYTSGQASSVLDMKSTSKGVLVPRMTNAQRTAISSPATGLLVYQTDGTPGFYYYNGSGWTMLAAGGSVSATAPITLSAGAVGITQASGSSDGYLDSAHWNTFNNKVDTSRLINTTAPLSGGGNLSANRTLSIADAKADSSTKGAATFTASDFNDTSGIISIDYTNGRAASTSQKGFLTSGDWNTFNNKASASAIRSSYVLVKSASDFPAPVSGVITLVAGTTYEINGAISLTSKINLNGCTVRGVDHDVDQLIYTPSSGELITGANGGDLYSLTLTAASAGAKVFNIDAGGASLNIDVKHCYVASSDNVGLVKGFGGNVFFDDNVFTGNTNGLTFQNDDQVFLHNQYWENSNHNTFITFTGTLSSIQILGGIMMPTSANTATGIDVSGISSLANGDLRTMMFNGSGTYTTGTFTNAWTVDCMGLTTQRDEVAAGNMFDSVSVATTIGATNSPVKVAGTTASRNLYRVTMPASNRLTYTGTKTRTFLVTCAASCTGTTNNTFFTFSIAKVGSVLTESKQKIKIASNTDQQAVAISCTVTLAPNEYVELWVENNTNVSDPTIVTFNLAMR
jgi:hypothetical protein